MTFRSRFASLAAALVLGAFALPALADTPPPEPSWYHYSWDIPILQGEYLPTDGGTLGSLSLGFTGDANHTFGGGTFFYDNAGKPVTLAIGGRVHYNDDATVIASGVIAWTDISSYSITDGPCRGCADHPRQQTQTADVAKFEWTGPRAGRYTVNGLTQNMVEATSGPPLVGATDFSGDWLMTWHGQSKIAQGQTGHVSFVRHVTLVPVTAPRSYATVVDPYPYNGGYTPIGTFALPSPGARLYDVVCSDVASGCPLDFQFWYPDNKATLATFWFDDTDSGGVVYARVSSAGGSTTYTVADTGIHPVRAYGRRDFIATRLNDSPFYSFFEIGLFRIGAQTLSGFKPPVTPQPQP